jgi:ADP-ribose pyrophosphatase YjhB (NUDIX family)
MGDFLPEDHVKKLEGCSFTAFIFNSISATCSESCLLIIMTQIYKVFVNNFFILITDSKKTENNLIVESVDLKYYVVYSVSELVTYLSQSNYVLTSHIVYKCEDSLKAFNLFKTSFKFIIAGGGLVKNKNNDILMIYKNKVWDLPKGKLNTGESLKNSALREVFEETHVTGLKIISEPFLTHHIYCDPNPSLDQYFLKETTWFLMKANFESNLTPQIEEGIFKVSWMPTANLNYIQTYESVKLVLKNFINH